MTDNRKIFNDLIKDRKIDINRSNLFDYDVEPLDKDSIIDRVEGMMLGLAIGDALGNTTEGQIPETRFSNHGEIRDYLPNRYANNEAVGAPTDDTQLAFWTLEQLIADQGFIPESLAARFCTDRIFGIGSTVRRFISNYKSGRPWYGCGPHSAGNGALMRIAPMLIPYVKTGGSSLWIDTALSAMLTHNDTGSISACLAFVYIYRQLMKMNTPPEPTWWIDAYAKIAKKLESGKTYKPRGGKFVNYKGTIWAYVNEKVKDAYDQDIPIVDACRSWYSGAYLLETLPSAIYILMKHGDDPEEAIVRAVNDTKDNDTIAAIVGAAVGALHGRKKLPERWVSNLLGRTCHNDDGRIFRLLNKVEDLWYSSTQRKSTNYKSTEGA